MSVNDIAYSVAGAADIEDIETLLGQTDMPGWITLSYQSDLLRAPMMSPNGRAQSVIGRTKSGALAGMASRLTVPGFWKGEVRPIGWSANLRLAHEFRNRPSVLRKGFDAFRTELHDAQETPWYLASILSDNTPARRLLERGLPGFPRFKRLFGFHTLAFSAKAIRSKAHIRAATPDDATGIVRFLNQQNQNRPLAPAFDDAEDFAPGRYPGLTISDFLICEEGNEIIGTVALWDQVPFRRLVVANYAQTLKRLRPLVNIAAPLTGLPFLPPLGQHLAMAHLAFFTVAKNDPKIAQALLDAARSMAKCQNVAFVSLSLADDDPLLHMLSKNRHRAYPANIYGVTWLDDEICPDAESFNLAKIEISLL